MKRLLAIVLLSGCSGLDPNIGPLHVEQEDGGEDAGSVSFARDIRPLLQRSKDHQGGRGCVPCHDGKAPVHNGKSLSGFDVASLGELRKGGGSTLSSIVVPGHPEASLLVKVLRGTFGSNRMPKGGPYWEAEEMKLLETWILEGAKGTFNE